MLDSPEYNDFVEKSKEYNLIPVYQEIRADLETPLSIYIKLSDNKYSFLLESITGGENLARYSIIGTNPRKVIKTGKNQDYGEVDPLEIVKDEIKSFKVPELEELPVFTGGAVGYLSYETISYFENTVSKKDNVHNFAKACPTYICLCSVDEICFADLFAGLRRRMAS